MNNKSLENINKTIITFLIITVSFILILSGIYVNLRGTAKNKTLDMYSTSLKIQYSAFNDEIGVIDGFCRSLKSDPTFTNIIDYDDPNLTQNAWGIYSSFVNTVKKNKYVTDTYIIFKNNNAAISKQFILDGNSSGPDLSCDGYNYAYLKGKVFSSTQSNLIFYSDQVYYGGKKSAALLYCKPIDGLKFSTSKSAAVSVIPIKEIDNVLKLNKIFGKKAVFAVYNSMGRAYESGKIGRITDYSVIDCDDNEGFSWCVYIKNDFFSVMTKYYYEIIGLFVAYVLVCITFIFLMSKNKQDAIDKESNGINSTKIDKIKLFEINRHINGLFMGRSDREENQWFRENIPDFPRPCIMALFLTEGADAKLISDTLEQLGKRPFYVYPDPSCHYVAFFNYYPDGKCITEIKKVLEKFIEKLNNNKIKTVISLSNPCVDIGEIYDAYMIADLMFKYNEYKSLICAGDVSENNEFYINVEDNNNIVKYIIAENAFDANKIIYRQWYELSQNPSFGDEIERLFVSQIGVLASVAIKIEYDRDFPKYDGKSSVTELAFEVTDIVNDMVSYIGSRPNNSALYNDVIKYIDDNFTNPDFSQPDIKEKFGISTKLITKILKQKKDMLFSEYLENLRIDKARYILSHSDIKIYDISKMCGYGTNDAFYKAFNKKVGMTPGLYRRSNNTEKTKKTKSND